MTGQLEGKVAIVTGAANGIGRATARLLAKHGAAVALVDIQVEAGREVSNLIKAEGGRALFIEADVRDTDQMNAMVAQTVKAFGGVDILYANAGVPGPAKPLEDWSDAEWDEVIETNLNGVFKSCRAVIPAMVKRGSGNIVMTASICGLKPIAGISAYNASKAAVISLTQTLAMECGAKKIRVNAIAPGIINTVMGQATLDDLGDSFNPVTMVPLGRIGEPEDIAQAVLYLVSDAASYTTGAVLTVDGGTILRGF